jgi:DNA-binding LacI/PurR family transcriptional regulator
MYSLPFTVSRQNRDSLIDQVADGLRSAIHTGHYRTGDILPNLQVMAAALNVSEIVTRRAVQRLTKEGLLNPRRGTGIAVCGTDTNLWRGHVLFIHWSGSSMYYHSVMIGTVIERLHAANILISTLYVNGADYDGDFVKVQAELSHVVSMVVIEGNAEKLDVLLNERKIPFIHLNDFQSSFSPQAVQGIILHNELMIPMFRDHCLNCGIRNILQVTHIPKTIIDISTALAPDGIVVDTLLFKPLSDLDDPEAEERGAMETILSWLDTKPVLPDMLWFPDDFVARGALLALTANGIRIPDDVQVISWANKGHGPVFIKSLTRVEMDPKAHGNRVAECILAQLNGKPIAGNPVEISPTFIEGDSTKKLFNHIK